MRRERREIIVECDGCHEIKETPNATAGFSKTGWEMIQGKDFCFVCSALIREQVYETMDQDILDQAIMSVQRQRGKTHPSLFDENLYTNLAI